ncbi:MAG: hypothetical protein ACRD3L_05405 [Terriglobales bacterium]
MRKLCLMVCSMLVLASLAVAQEKSSSQWNCSKPSEAHSIDVGDRANHTYAVSKTTCTANSGEVGGVKEKEGIGTQFNETMGDTTTWHGVFVVTAENGDKIYYHYSNSGKGMAKDGQFESGSNKWMMAGGTGKFAKLKGEGSCTGKGDGAGGATWDCTGTYSMK